MGKNDFYTWTIDKGDYLRDEYSTLSYQKKIITRKKIKITLFTFIYCGIISAITYLIFVTL